MEGRIHSLDRQLPPDRQATMLLDGRLGRVFSARQGCPVAACAPESRRRWDPPNVCKLKQLTWELRLEALASATPSILSPNETVAAATTAEKVRLAGDPMLGSLASALVRALQPANSAMATPGRGLAGRRFSWMSHASELEEDYAGILDRSAENHP